MWVLFYFWIFLLKHVQVHLAEWQVLRILPSHPSYEQTLDAAPGGSSFPATPALASGMMAPGAPTGDSFLASTHSLIQQHSEVCIVLII